MIRALGREDAEAFQQLRLLGLGECPSAFSSSYDEECRLSLEEVGGKLSPTDGRVVVGAFEDGRLVGIVGLGREPEAKLAHKAFLWGVYVHPEFRYRGIGRELMCEALERARDMPGVRQVNLGVNASNGPALALYRSMGFTEFGREAAFMLVDGVLHDEVHMVAVVRDT